MNADTEIQATDELATLKERATLLGLTFHPSIGVEKLREKVAEKLAEGEAKPLAAAVAEPEVESVNAKRTRQKREAMALVRIRVACMNPAKKEWDGEIFTVGNATIGSVKKYVPFNTEEGWHVPNVIYQMMKERTCQIFVAGKSKNGVTTRQGKLIKEFSIEVLDPLTKAELHELAQRQAMAKAID